MNTRQNLILRPRDVRSWLAVATPHAAHAHPPAADGATSFSSIDGIALDTYAHRPATAACEGAVVLAHGISADLDEGGMYRRLGNRLAAHGFGVLRFSFRGHGRSGGTARGMTIAGEMLDITAAIDQARAWFDGPLAVVASSFGAVSALETARFTHPDLLVLWNPILDLRRTFIDPELPWGRENFGPDAWLHADESGYLLLDGEFEVGRVLLDELRRYEPESALAAMAVPTLVVHGDHDSYVSYDIARAAAESHGCPFHTVRGSDHGFDSDEHEDEAIDVTVTWLREQIAHQ